MTQETEAPEGDETSVTMDRLAKVYIKMRDKIAALTKDYDAQIEAIKTQQTDVAGAMKDLLRSTGGTSLKTQYGTVTLKTSTRYVAQDWEAMHQFILEHQAPHLLEKRIAQGAMKDFLEENPSTVPAGLNTMSEVTVAVTKPRI